MALKCPPGRRPRSFTRDLEKARNATRTVFTLKIKPEWRCAGKAGHQNCAGREGHKVFLKVHLRPQSKCTRPASRATTLIIPAVKRSAKPFLRPFQSEKDHREGRRDRN